MAVESKDSKKKRSTYQAIGAVGRTRRSIRFILQIVFAIILITLLLLCLYGYINQVQTGKAMVESILELGQKVGDSLMLIFTGDPSAPLDVTDNGIYLDGHAPDGSQPIFDGSGVDGGSSGGEAPVDTGSSSGSSE